MNRKEEARVDAGGVPLPTRLVDGYHVHRAALARDLDVLSLPRQVLLAGTEATVPSQVSFTHGVPEASGLSAVTFAQDQRLTRALLERAQVPKPAGASFSWRSISKAEKWASNLGFPVLVREGVGENPARAIRQLNSAEELRAAFNQLRRRDKADRTPGSNPHIAGYATTRLTFTYDEEGNEVAPLRSRMLVEEDPFGRAIRGFVLGGRLITAVELDGDRNTGVREVTEELDPEVIDVLVKAAEAVPGLACATVDVLDERSGPARGPLVMSVAERPRIETYLSAKHSLGDLIGDALLEFQAREANIALGTSRTSLKRHMEIEGLRHAAEAADQLPNIAENYGAEISIDNADAVTGDVEATATGSPEVLAALAELLMAGELLRDRAAAVNYSKGPSID
ncbi:hypothetical protein [Garicola koreensis]|uniref:ATP-grasp domain-containing protein n=1 Tax=Garicola koreensis TaxID=1262554 RepID=A0A7W5TTI4_9MICC|nr:hypothetical protein [Garicola koreensis]MBB3667228.1 hypothetical protein [Garicola koreensis]